jgi:ribosomal protein S18 acetylase RimI-like enzyme
MIPPRPYRAETDLERARQLLQAGRRANNGGYYVHVGDLNWWIFYQSPGLKREEQLYLWENTQDPAQLDGWALLSEDWQAFDVFVRPDLRGTLQAAEMVAWAQARLQETISRAGGNRICTIWIAEHDEWMASILENLGFQLGSGTLINMSCSLEGIITEPELPEGYAARRVVTGMEAAARAAAQAAAFQSNLSWETYLERYLKFMRSCEQLQVMDLGVFTPDGRVASFCILWLDPLNQVGLFEPVGTHPDFQRKGLGQSIMLEGLRWLQAQGMTSAIVNAESTNTAAIHMYRSVGFSAANQLRTYERNW